MAFFGYCGKCISVSDFFDSDLLRYDIDILIYLEFLDDLAQDESSHDDTNNLYYKVHTFLYHAFNEIQTLFSFNESNSHVFFVKYAVILSHEGVP